MIALLKDIHDEADHAIGTEAGNHKGVAIKNAKNIKRAAKINHDEFIKHAASHPSLKEGELEMDPDALISRPADNETGAYVQAWLWVENPDCADCGERIKGEPIYSRANGLVRCRVCHQKNMENK